MVGDFNADVINKPLSPPSIAALACCALQEFVRKSFIKSAPQFTYVNKFKNGTTTSTTIDHCFISARFASALKDVSVKPNPIGSDHRILRCRLRVQLKRKSSTARCNPIDWSLLPPADIFAESVFTAMDSLLEGPRLLEGIACKSGLPWGQVLPSYSIFASAVRLCAPRRVESVCSRSTPTPSQPLIPRSITSMADVKLAKELSIAECTAVINRFVELSKNQPAAAWREIHRLTSTKSRSLPTSSTPAQILSHFQSVNGNERPFTRAPFRKRHAAAGLVVDRDFSKKELLDAIASLKTGKAAGIDEIPSEILRLPPFTDLLLRFSNDYLAGEVPLEVLVTRLVLVPKKGDKSIVENYRGIAIISVFLKLINRMLLHRLRVLDTVLRYGQNGFRPGRSTSSHVMALSLLAELDLPFAVLFVDFAKAFDSVSFAAITAMLDAFCVPHRLMSAVLNCYRNHAVWVGADGSYQLKSGVLQGDTLAPWLFVLILDCILDEAITPDLCFPLHRSVAQTEPSTPATSRYNFRHRSFLHSGIREQRKLAELSFADDIALPCCSRGTAQRLLTNIQLGAKHVGLDVNVAKGKTEILLHRFDASAAEDFVIYDTTGKLVTIAKDYKYLGNRPFDPNRGLSERVGLAWAAIRRLAPIWQAKCTLQLKLQLLRSLATSILLAGCESWTPKLGQVADRAFAHMLRYVMGTSTYTSSPFFVAEIDLFAMARTPHVSSIAVERQLILVGHSLRQIDALNVVIHHKLHVDLRKARLHLSLRHRIPYPIEDWGILALDRKGWKSLATSAAYLNEEKVQRSLLLQRKARWTSFPRVSNRIYLLLAEDLQYHNYHVSRSNCGHWLKPYSMHAHFNPFVALERQTSTKSK
jgi:hypothetical protein